MLKELIYFGERVDGFDRPVINEREARAGAGILLLPAMFSFLNAYFLRDFLFTKIFITIFMIDFAIRVLINPKFAPSLILGRFFVQNQTPEYVGATQKRFAWSLGLILSVVMFVIVIVVEFMSPIRIVICLLCIGLLFSETAFGICLGCIVYNKVFNEKAKYCPGGVCEIKQQEEIQKISKIQWFILSFAMIGIMMLSFSFSNTTSVSLFTDSEAKEMKCGSGKCGK
jgi:uncharacterized integral membrane protein